MIKRKFDIPSIYSVWIISFVAFPGCVPAFSYCRQNYPSFLASMPPVAARRRKSFQHNDVLSNESIERSESSYGEEIDFDNIFKEEVDGDEPANVNIPSVGFSVSDELEYAQKDRFVTEVVPIKGLSGVAQLLTRPVIRESFEPIRYLVSLSPPTNTTTVFKNSSMKDEKNMMDNMASNLYVIVDVPPFSAQLVNSIKAFMGSDSKLVAILITNRDGIHYDEASAVYSNRRSDLDLWKQIFPTIEIIGYRLDIPRDCRPAFTQVLDGYSPFALQENDACKKFQFVETGRPLTYMEWNHHIVQDVLSGKPPPDDNDLSIDNTTAVNNADYSAAAIYQREQGKRILAIHTPGHTYGSVSYIFPEMGLCCSGYTIPVEDNRLEENVGRGNTGPALDCRGYITTSRAGIKCQMNSARKLVKRYGDRFSLVLPSHGDPLSVDGDEQDRKEILYGIISQYEKVGEVYEQLGIMSDDGDMDW